MTAAAPQGSERQRQPSDIGCPFPEFVPSDHDQAVAHGTLERLRTAQHEHTSAGALAGRDPDQLTLQIWALAHGMASLELQGALGEAEVPRPSGPRPST